MIGTLFASFFLSVFGILNIFGVRHSSWLPQLFFVFVAFIGYAMVRTFRTRFFQVNTRFLYWFFLSLLIITYVIGLEVKGSRRWIDFYFFKFQSSEFFKIVFILFLSDLFSFKKEGQRRFMDFASSLIYFAIPTFIVFKQPDLGNAMVYIAIYLSVLLFSYLPKKYILYLLLIFFCTMPLGWHFLKSYQKERISSFFNPHVDQQGTAYNMIQAVITSGSGQFFGKGLGFGTQSKLFFLPENHTDFAYSSLVEQFGFFGGVVVIILYGVISFHLFQKIFLFISDTTREGKRYYLYTIGFLSYFITQVIVNISMNLGLLPITGITLPFISYGGSSIVTILWGLALIP